MKNADSIRGSVLRIERSSIYDGDGLRTVLFLKGCPLHCTWCSTPESQKMQPERGVTGDKCTLCGKCVSLCPRGALFIDGDKVRLIKNLCQGCFKCAKACPNGAIVTYGSLIDTRTIGRELSKDGIFFFHSGGGVTISGGEPFAQPEFLLGVLRECNMQGIDCALESCFFADWNVIERALPYVSLIHADIKHIDSAKHKLFTGVDNDKILDNIMRVAESVYNFRLILRMPLIPGINDGDDEIKRLAEFVNKLQKADCMEFLAYHRLGVETYSKLDIKYTLSDVGIPSADYMLQKAVLFQHYSKVPVKINGQSIP